jgi:hypothetical protein
MAYKSHSLGFKKDLHGNAPPPKPTMGLQHANLTSNKDIAS